MRKAQSCRTCALTSLGLSCLAQSIEELSEIFKELAVLVIDQGTILDRIDFNMEQVGASGVPSLRPRAIGEETHAFASRR